ncbi:MAG: UbiH/UbiF family hydroxylase [Gallionella sp.]|nr:UbiH/UbiF family hydroxylase [Gallionella sp.]
MKTSKKYDVVIVGGGLVGASLAAALKNSGLALALVEAGSPPDMTALPDDWDSRIYAISPGSRTFLEHSGAWSLLDSARINPVEEMRVFGDIDSKLEFSAYQMGVTELACILENRHLQHALWQVLQTQDNLDFIHPARCAALTFAQDATQLTLEDGTTLSAGLFVGADGRNSWVRNQAGITAAPVDYQHHGVVANFSCELPHRCIAHQWFAPDGILALLPLPGNQVSMVWSVTPEKSAQLTALTSEALCTHVEIASQHTLGKLTVITAAAAFPLRLLTLPHISAPRVALIGDAAHNMHPLAGQGVNTGFRDARQLADLLINRGGCADCGDAQLLRRYDRKRREDIATMQGTTYALKNLFCNDDPLLRTLRNTGLNATNHLVPLKKALMRHAFN